MQAPSVAPHSEMETEPCCEEHKDSSEEPTKPDIKQATCESANSDGHVEMPCGSTEEGNDPFVGKQAEAETREVGGDCTEKKTHCEPRREAGAAECMEQRKLKKTNSWKMVRFQDPSEEDDVSDRDTSAESLFAEYALREWTSSTFEELFSAEDWQDITGENISCRYSDKTNLLLIYFYFSPKLPPNSNGNNVLASKRLFQDVFTSEKINTSGFLHVFLFVCFIFMVVQRTDS